MLRSILLFVAILISGILPSYADQDNGRILRPEEMQAMSNGTYRPDSFFSYGSSSSKILESSRKYTHTTRWRNVTLWCADHVNRALADVNIRGTGSRAAGSFLQWGQRVTSPQPGDVVVLSRKNSRAVQHVGFFVRVADNGAIVVHSGNTRTSAVAGRTVAENAYSAHRVLGYRRAPVQLASLH